MDSFTWLMIVLGIILGYAVNVIIAHWLEEDDDIRIESKVLRIPFGISILVPGATVVFIFVAVVVSMSLIYILGPDLEK